MKTAVFLAIAPCSLVEVDTTFQRYVLLPSSERWKASVIQRDYTALYPKRLSSSNVDFY
jgi:hypothetical protein